MMTLTMLWLVLAVSQTSQPSAPTPAVAGNVETGGRLFMKHTCYYCHGTVGQGGVAGARVAAVARNAQSFIRYVRRPSGQMPAYTEKILSDRELTDIFAYLRSLPPAKAVRDIPLLSAIK